MKNFIWLLLFWSSHVISTKSRLNKRFRNKEEPATPVDPAKPADPATPADAKDLTDQNLADASTTSHNAKNIKPNI